MFDEMKIKASVLGNMARWLWFRDLVKSYNPRGRSLTSCNFRFTKKRVCVF